MKSVPLHADFPLSRAGRLPSASAMYMLPDWLHEPFGWAQHIPFAFWLMETHRPSVVVELGTHYGNSYFAFCQAASALQIPTACYAIDTWRGDEHAGFYGEEVYEAVERHNRARYDVFSRLVRSTFDEARPHFSDGSIDLLHIDGLHTYESCKHDFDNWLPSLSDRGVVIMHDTNVRERNFGVGRLWSELKQRYPSFEFSHAHGLGVLGVGENLSETLKELLAADRNDRIATSTRHIFWRIGASLTAQAAIEGHAETLARKDKESSLKDEELQRKADEFERRGAAIAYQNEEIARQANLLARNAEELAGKDRALVLRDQELNLQQQEFARRAAELAEASISRDAEHAEASNRKDAEFAEALNRKDAELADVLNRKDAEHSEALNRKGAELAEISEQLRDAKAANQEGLKRAESLVAEQTRLLGVESELRARCRKLESSAQSALAEQARAEEEKSEIRGRLNAAYDRISEIDAAGRARSKDLSDLQSVLELNKATVELLTTALAEGKGTIANMASALADSDRALSEAQLMLNEREKGLERLQREKQELRDEAQLHYHGLISHFRNSTSWRVTRPLRALKQMLPRQAPQILSAPKSFRPKSDDAAVVIAESGLFDPGYYRSRAGKTMRDPIAHFLEHGHKSGINPNPLFDCDYYSTLYGAHLDETTNPLVHYIATGSQQGLNPSRLFQTRFYLQANPGVRNLEIAPLLHYLTIGRLMGLMPIDINVAKLNHRALKLHRLDLTRSAGEEFDAELYAELSPELAGGNHAADYLRRHYETIGRAEGRIGSLRAFLQAVKMPPEAVPINFEQTEYYELNGDLASVLPCTFYVALRHYLEFGISEGRRYSFSQCYIDASSSAHSGTVSTPALEVAAASRKVACLVHVYYPELWPALYSYIRNLDGISRDVFVNLTDSTWSHALQAEIRRDVPDASIVISENRGRDIGGHLNSLRGIRFSDYSAFFLLHTKKSKHLSDKYSETWRNSLLDPLMGTPEKVQANLGLLNSDRTVGVIGAAAWRHSRVDSNTAHYRYLLRKAGLDQDETCDFVSGTMMIVRSQVMKQFYDLLAGEEFENADGKSIDWLRDGQLEHAAERLFGNLNKALGYRFQWR